MELEQIKLECLKLAINQWQFMKLNFKYEIDAMEKERPYPTIQELYMVYLKEVLAK